MRGIFKKYDPRDPMAKAVWWFDDYFGIVVSCADCGHSIPLRDQYDIEKDGTTSIYCPNPKCSFGYQPAKLKDFHITACDSKPNK